jgi:hypothetical protein
MERFGCTVTILSLILQDDQCHDIGEKWNRLPETVGINRPIWFTLTCVGVRDAVLVGGPEFKASVELTL